jgi:hypothetical protein
MAFVVMVVIAFLVGGFLFRKRKPEPELVVPTLPCPHCRKPARYRVKSITATIECRDCGSVDVVDSEPIAKG